MDIYTIYKLRIKLRCNLDKFYAFETLAADLRFTP